ncbi:MAG: lysophospholipase L1-like esterase [Acidimicrobiales bacterium]
MVVPSLVTKKPALGLRALGLVSPGVRRVSAQIEPYTAWWDEQNQRAAKKDGPLWVVIGDSTSIGIGASAPDLGYVGRLLAGLQTQDPVWRVINLAMSGARVADGLDRQLPILASLPTPDLVTMCLGSNDVFWERSLDLRDRLRSMVAQLPSGSFVASAAGVSERARLTNRTLRSAAAQHSHHSVNPWNEPGSGTRLAADRFHPSDLGYAYMARPFARAIGVPLPEDVQL